MAEVIKILIVEDHKLISQTWKIFLEGYDHFKVIGQTDNGKDAFELCLEHRPDIVLMDINLKDSNGIDATFKITNSLPRTKVIGLSLHSDVSIVKRLIAAGAKGYLSKNIDCKEMVDAIEKVYNGELFIAAEIKNLHFNTMICQTEKDKSKKELTTKEIEIIKLIAVGHTSKVIGDMLFISARTVDTHRYNILKKLEIFNAAQLSSWAIQKGYV